jgi:hypothetical protein
MIIPPIHFGALMGKLVRPILFSDHFRLPALDLEKRGLLDPILNADTKLFIDPLLLRKSQNIIIKKSGLPLLRKRFGDIIRLAMASRNTGDAAWKAAQKLMNLDERREICLGFGGSGVSGSSRPGEIKHGILRTTREIVELGIDDPEIISLMGFLEDGVGPDTISDLTTNALFPALEKITAEICKRHKIPRQRFIVEGREVLLPTNHLGGRRNGIALVPCDILRDLPIAADWSDVSRVAFENRQIRERVNALIADFARATIRQKKAVLKKAALQSARTFRAMFDGLVEGNSAYDLSRDDAGIHVLRQGLREIAKRYPLRIIAPSTPTRAELARVVQEIVAQFRNLIENNDLADLLWDGDKARHEKAAQLLFFGIAEAYCRANNIDISPETDSGGGPVDFKFSTGYVGRFLVEIKLSSGRVVHGFSTQLGVYKKAAGQCDAVFLVIDVGQMGGKLTKIRKMKADLVKAGKEAPEIETVDSKRKRSASKR